jgi:EmrB/QacA subfamily drug resistance transporter
LDQTIAEQPLAAVAAPRRGPILLAALIATFIPAVESAIVATAIPTIVGDLGGFQLLSWVFAVPLLAQAVTIPLYGRLADIYGRKRIFFTGTSIFLVGTLLCGFARSTAVLILFRAIQGLGSGAIQPIAITIIGDVYTPAERARIQGYFSSVFGLAAIVGPALGAFLVLHVHWSVVFWVNVPIGLIAIAMFATFLDERIERREHSIDYPGGMLLVVGVGALMVALVQGRTLGLQNIAGLAILGVSALGLLFVHERRTAEPMLPLRLWRLRVVALSNCAGFGASAVMMAASALLPIFVQGVMGRSPAVAGLVIGAQSVSWMFASFAAGRLMVRTSYRLTAAIGGVCLVAGALVLLALDPASDPLTPAIGAFLLGIGMGFCNTTFLVAIQASVGWHERGVGTGSQMFMRMLGQSVGAAVFGAIINFGVDRRLPGAGDLVNRMLDPATRQSLGPDMLTRLADAVGLAAHEAFIVALVIAVATLAATLALPARLSPLRPAAPSALSRRRPAL